jgi:hypothetical protein
MREYHFLNEFHVVNVKIAIKLGTPQVFRYVVFCSRVLSLLSLFFLIKLYFANNKFLLTNIANFS